ncbi:ribonucleoside-diphosphate reductase subunit alpha [Kroppenstedtia pulmonis]|uniref:Ribonucleoside-diphosphate reductase n=2 Tax=Kroppenstedtia pulmonis TaxID=1380685 RepID=A0A7D4CXF8_9BACL|nr:ribonucleoside-diphosphate reductase subunit alpha [Kroppenstedtia pulmonis]QKG85837.1 ribonucleoside-diphosphate reductase subunit alpha [Kroppenstedtia pulmonis]
MTTGMKEQQRLMNELDRKGYGWLREILDNYPHLDAEAYLEQFRRYQDGKGMMKEDSVTNQLVLNALERISQEEPDWTYVAAGIYARSLYRKAGENRDTSPDDPYGSFSELLDLLTEQGIYDPYLLKTYSREEIREISSWIDPERDRLFTYIGLRTLADRYLAKSHDNRVFELPQERFMVIAMTLMSQESEKNRLYWVREAYWALSNLYMTVATPTLANAGKTYGQLSSCFIDTVDDSLRGIYDSNTDVATLSKGGGGLGIYMGKVRSRGSDIKGFKGISSGVLPWMKQLNNTAVSVDQLGQRQGSIAVYLDVWHRDIFAFLDAKLNNGDERLRTHDLFTGVCVPDLFMEQVDNRGEWHLFDPHEVRRVMGWSLEDFYDEEKGAGSFREKYQACIDHPELSRETVPAIEVMKRIMISQLETGTPYMFYRDEANRMNPNRHAGMIYSSNLCTEIMQNMSITQVEEEKTEEGKIIITKQPGDFVVCNLSSINLGTAVPVGILERLIPVQVRMLDNVIDLNTIEVLQARLTNQKYRAVGLGTFGWHHLLALKRIHWESEESLRYADELYERISYLVIQASMELAREKGTYPVFEGSDWQTGEYFRKRNYTGEKWEQLAEMVRESGIRNGYLMAVAPNGSTSVIAGSTASIDPVFQREYSEEKKNYKIPVTAPDLSPQTYWFYKSAYEIDPYWSIRQNAARQRHIDQSQSFNLYVTHDIKAKDLLSIHMTAWKQGLKTTYYTRSTSAEYVDCDSCSG